MSELTQNDMEINALSHLIAKRFVELSKMNIDDHGSFHVALSGGNTPKLFYSLLASLPYKDQVSWQHIYIYQTDERFVPHNHEDNNFKQLYFSCLTNVNIPYKQIFRMQTENITPEKSAEEYQKQLYSQLPRNIDNHPQFDFILLGVGIDGHIASLFPQSNAVSILNKLVISSYVEHLQCSRISLTLQALNHSKIIAFLIVGENKAPIVNAIFKSKTKKIYPAQMLKPTGQIEWYLESKAAKLLETEMRRV